MANITVEDVSTIVANIYEAAYDQARWYPVVTALREMMGGSRCCIARIGPRAGGSISTVDDPELNEPRATEVFLRDPIALKAVALPIGKIHDYAHIEGEAAWHASEVWQDLFRPRDMHRGLLCNLFSSGDAYWMIDVHRSAWQEPFAGDQIDFFQKLAPHLLRAGQISRRLENTSALASAFSHLPFGMFMVNGHCRILQMNEVAETLLALPGGPFELKEGEIVLSDAQDTMSLRRLVVDACSSSDGVMPGTGGAMLVPSEHKLSDHPRLVLSVAPYVDTQAYGLTGERRAVIMVNEVTPRAREGLDLHVRALFDLTPSEARLAAGLVSGRSLKEIAASGGITVKTGRTYLERIFAKTATRQQSELVALLKNTEPLRRR
ncbi:helix-turn-helix transcriptional regulator [Mesorhizobium sp. B2-3-4]|uniref:helix-turn-helix transcriptional regulator n=1 Tax=Mesorhizobium sp. B2-3-4 TaxID=2589959 RepID=UPI00112D886A|nr:helix-turn-helix transcriptional regulator [Mesorhizobium sp. B2-3-4]TPM24857.1 helix-turn-helix transcriptional regulator [Mesorhizobium sp. B2-3-4]